MTWLHTHRYWLARRSTQLMILLLFWLGAQLHLGVLTGDLSASHLFRVIPLADPYAVLQILATGHVVAGTALLGAFYALVGRRSCLRVGFDADRCYRCGDCLDVCPEAQVIDFKTMSRTGFIDSGECLNCARCLEVCPRDAFHFTLRLRRGTERHFRQGDRHAIQDAA